MNTIAVTTSLALVLAVALTSGCDLHRTQELDSRLSSAEDMAEGARVRSNEAYTKAEQALKAALEAQQSADAANKRASRMLDKK
ncbi:Lpp/OprI family alanine-zipper lipoprotein [Pseudomonas sp. RIT-To-2]|uniref:Lpp/OprI family alanine-zipper lipoprotein n=1 Tax=Pseudomonas sp. RIT-To-2 TaxID=3462541 RepID=UPI00241303C4